MLRRRTGIDGDTVSLRNLADSAIAEVESGAVDEIRSVEREDLLSQNSICGNVSRSRERRDQNKGSQQNQQQRG